MSGQGDTELARRLERLAGAGVSDLRATGSQFAYRHYRASLADGRVVFVKAATGGEGAALTDPALRAEARGLAWLHEAGAVPVPGVVGYDESTLVISWVQPGTADAASAERFGRDLAGPAEPPSRIHGDCWSGNVLWSGGRGWLIDPAAHGGHRETDLAMLALFGAPFLDRILASYDEVAPLAAGWRARVPLHQLHPLLVHACLFGAGYAGPVADAARAALAA